MKKNLRNTLVLFSLILCLLLSACGGGSSGGATTGTPTPGNSTEPAASNPVTLKVGSQDTAESITAQLLKEFKAAVEEKSDGEITIDLYFSSTLGSLNDMIEGVSMGTIDMVTAGISPFQSYCDNMLIFDQYIMSGPEDFIAVWESEVGQEVLGELREDAGIYILGYNLCGVGRIDYWFNKDYSGLADLKNANLRTNGSKTANLVCEAIGAVGVAVSNAEQYNAIQTGLVDAMSLDAANMLDQGYIEKGMYQMDAVSNYLASSLSISQKTWEKLTPAQQEIITECAAAFSAGSVERYEAQQADTEARLLDAGVIKCSVSAEEKETINGLVNEALFAYYADICDKEYLDRVIAIVEANRAG